MTVFVGVYC